MEFSVLMSLYYKEKVEYFRQALDSIINQTILPKKIVIVKDGSLSKELDDICNLYALKYPNLIEFVQLPENKGLGIALQIGLDYCPTDIVARMDTDDIAVFDRFEKQINEFYNDSSLSILGTSIKEFSKDVNIIESVRKVPLFNEEIIQYAKKRNPFNHMTVMFRKKAVIDVGNYQSFYLCEDYYLWFRLIKKGYKAKNLDESLVFARIGKDMFKRRGGVEYFLQEIKLQNIFYENNFISKYEYIRNVLYRLLVRLVPNFMREIIYRKYIRNT